MAVGPAGGRAPRRPLGAPEQLHLLPAPLHPEPSLERYDVLLANSSGGKDSAAMLAVLVERAKALEVEDRIVVVHADLGRMEWPGTRAIAESHADRYGLRFEVVTRTIIDPATGERRRQDLLEHIQARGKFPDAARRYCTSDHKRAPIHKLLTRLVAEQHAAGRPYPIRVLNVMGLRADESPARAKQPAFRPDERASNGRRLVKTWLPIHDWTEREVWARVRRERLAIHPAYTRYRMPRLSCRLCVLASRSALRVSASAPPNRELVADYVRVERAIGHRFRKDLSVAEIQAHASSSPVPRHVENWAA